MVGYGSDQDETYLATQRNIAQFQSARFTTRKINRRIGSSHTKELCGNPIAMAMEGMTTPDKAEKRTNPQSFSCNRCWHRFDA